MIKYCVNCQTENDLDAGICTGCGMGLARAPIVESALKVKEEAERERQRLMSLVVTTGFEVQGRPIIQYLDVITSEIVMGTGFLTELLGNLADIWGTRSGKFEQRLRDAKDAAMYGLRASALNLGAEAVIGVDIDYMNIGENMLMVVASGTAVKLKESAPGL